MKSNSHLKPSKKQLRYLPAQSISPKDDSYHGTKYLLDIEWWYFDAVFENGYSVHIGFRIYHIKNRGLLQTRINIYHNGQLIIEKIKRSIFSQSDFSREKPIVQVDEKTVLSFSVDTKKQGKPWIYTIDLGIEDVHLHLKFIGKTPGWKIETESTCWTVPLPLASVQGTMIFNDKKMNVNGSGYHDHNWGYSPTTVLQNIGWFWGRISAETLHLTWANTIASPTKQDLIAVINRLNNNSKKSLFTTIHPSNISFTPSAYKKIDQYQIPHTFEITFQEKDKNNDTLVSAHLQMNTIDVHYDRIFIIHYWRYHVETTGKITYGNKVEHIENKPQIIEYLRFKTP